MTRERPEVRRVSPGEIRTIDEVLPAEYVDAFVVTRASLAQSTAEDIVRAALDAAPALVRIAIRVAHRDLMRFRLGPQGSPSHVIGWRIVESGPQKLRLEASSPLVEGTMVVRRTGPDSANLVTALRYRRPMLMRGLWGVVGPIHRRVAPLLMQRGARASAGRSGHS